MKRPVTLIQEIIRHTHTHTLPTQCIPTNKPQNAPVCDYYINVLCGDYFERQDFKRWTSYRKIYRHKKKVPVVQDLTTSQYTTASTLRLNKQRLRIKFKKTKYVALCDKIPPPSPFCAE